MRVLLLSLFHPELVRGGAQQICYELFKGLKATDGVQPTLLAAIDPSLATFYKPGARITGFDGRPDEFLFLGRDYDYLWHRSGSVLLAEAYVDFLQTLRPDVVHFHHFLLFGIDLLTLTRRTLPDAKLVFTFHEFMAICSANGHLTRLTDQSLCDRASAVRCHQCFPERGPEHFFLRERWMKLHLGVVDLYTTPSAFMIDMYARWGLPRERIRHIPNAHTVPAMAPSALHSAGASQNRFGYFGQLVDSKGVHILLKAVELLRAQGFVDFSVDLNGDNLRYGSSERQAELEAFLLREAALPPEQRVVTLKGSYELAQLPRRMAAVDWCVIPSVWQEAFGLVLSEAWSYRRPVICSDVGALAERVQHQKNGLLFNAGDPQALADRIRTACTTPGLWRSLSERITAPARRDVMVEGYLREYREGRA